MKTLLGFLTIYFFLLGSYSFAGEADVVDVQISKSGANVFNFNVTVWHKDIGWKHYANKWDIIDEKGNVLATRVLHHPHVDEQPFTRSLSRVKIPSDIKTVTIRAHDPVHKYGGKYLNLKLP